VDALGIPLGTLTASANRHDSPPLLAPTLDAVVETLGELCPRGRASTSTAATTPTLPASV
jgi:hypothetical protein